jgi:hypothetical protein
MSMPDAVMQALEALRVRIVNADAVGQALQDAAGEETPSWVFVYRSQVGDVEAASEALEAALYRHFRGDGGCAPHGDSVLVGGDSVRGLDAGAPCPSSRPDQPVFNAELPVPI